MNDTLIRKCRENVIRWWAGQDRVKLGILVSSLVLMVIVYFSEYWWLFTFALSTYYLSGIVNKFYDFLSARITNYKARKKQQLDNSKNKDLH